MARGSVFAAAFAVASSALPLLLLAIPPHAEGLSPIRIPIGSVSASSSASFASPSSPPIRRRLPPPLSASSSPSVDTYTPPDLSGTVALVTGATRGIGKGIALELGASGATVYVAGRSSRSNASGATADREFDGMEDCTVESTADEIDAMDGPGRGIPVKCDVRDEGDVEALVSRVRNDRGGRIDLVVCSAFATPPGLSTPQFRAEFWEQGSEMWDTCHGVGLRGAYLTCRAAAPAMIETAKGEEEGKRRPLMVLISSFGGKSYTFNVAYGVGKAACDRLAADMSVQLAKHGVDVVSLYPGVVRTEGNVAMDKRGEWKEASGGFSLKPGESESPRFSGRAVAALASSPDLTKERTGGVEVVAELAKELGFTDVDGTMPPSIRSLRFILPGFVFPKVEKESGKPVPDFIKNNVPDYLLPWSVFSGGPPPEMD